MKYQRILTVQDISCVGQCSLTVALPILSACGLETAILPSAVLSTHTAGFRGYTFRDLTEDLAPIISHWEKEGIDFAAVYTGYLGSAKQIAEVKKIFGTLLAKGGKKIVDPAMADNGKLYPGFDAAFVDEMKKLAFEADLLLPNITEASLLTDMPYRESYDTAYIEALCERLHRSGVPTVVLTGVGFDEGYTGIWVSEAGNARYYRHEKLPKSCHGTGDVYSSAFVGAYLQGRDAYEAAAIAADYTLAAMKATLGDDSHWYGVKFEKVLPVLTERLS